MTDAGELPAAEISADGMYRYFLSRRWSSAPLSVAFIGLNPSTADAEQNDPTIRRCIRFAEDWGAGALFVVNLFAYRSTLPAALRIVSDPIGPKNDEWLERAVNRADLVVAAWGNHGKLLDRGTAVSRRFRGKLQCLTLTKGGMPGHPLYVRADTKLSPFGEA